MADFIMDEKSQRIFVELRRVHLRHPGMVRGRIARMCCKDRFTSEEIALAHQEWLRLGLHESRDMNKGDVHA